MSTAIMFYVNRSGRVVRYPRFLRLRIFKPDTALSYSQPNNYTLEQ